MRDKLGHHSETGWENYLRIIQSFDLVYLKFLKGGWGCRSLNCWESIWTALKWCENKACRKQQQKIKLLKFKLRRT